MVNGKRPPQRAGVFLEINGVKVKGMISEALL